MARQKNIYSEYDVDMVEEFEDFLFDHLEEYAAIQECIERYSKAAGKPVSVKLVIENLRNGIDPKYKKFNFPVNNNWVPLYQRRILFDRPDLDKYLTKVRKSFAKIKE